jgi:hypothetical protein
MSEQENDRMTDKEVEAILQDTNFMNSLGMVIKNKFIQDNFEVVYSNTFYLIRLLSEILSLLNQKGTITLEDIKKMDNISKEFGEHKLKHALENVMNQLSGKEVVDNDV